MIDRTPRPASAHADVGVEPHRLQADGATIVDLLWPAFSRTRWSTGPFIVRGVSDVDDARTVYLFPSDMQLTLLEREVSKESLHARLRPVIGELLTACAACST